MAHFSPKFLSALTGGALSLALGLTGSTAHAAGIIKNPGDHPDYAVELEPHGILGWGGGYWGANSGFGLGMHAIIPFLKNGPIEKINNNMGIGFGLDWVHYSGGGCGYWGRGVRWAGCDMSANSFIFPAFVQWNFFFTDIISVYGEAGLFIAHQTVSWDGCTNVFGVECDQSHTSAYPWFTGGGRFLFGETVGLNVRLGYPMLTIGVSILL